MAELKAIAKCSCGNEIQMTCALCFTRTCRLCCKCKSPYIYKVNNYGKNTCIICNACIEERNASLKEKNGCIIL